MSQELWSAVTAQVSEVATIAPVILVGPTPRPSRDGLTAECGAAKWETTAAFDLERKMSASHAGLYGVDLEPDPRYQRCCSNIFRPGRVLRDCCLGLVVLLVIAAVIGAMFLLVFFVLKGATLRCTAADGI
ncbi:hypothetical protein FJT64_017072 [Amphibalanus amphitrite]|uniref:Uncharacterized protein n=1 Tax=Amphibalanus amphitrite TaxID=1232801 RepID=A0A6A4X3T5_AMPAM|nr:hypothetical protein FJT64_017072 [Amphibalanus amphitrite]